MHCRNTLVRRSVNANRTIAWLTVFVGLSALGCSSTPGKANHGGDQQGGASGADAATGTGGSTAARTGGLFVEVSDDAGQLVAGATVTTDPATASMITDSLGSVLYPAVAEGVYAVTALHPSLGAARTPVQVTSGAVARVVLRLSRGTAPRDGGADATSSTPDGSADATPIIHPPTIDAAVSPDLPVLPRDAAALPVDAPPVHPPDLAPPPPPDAGPPVTVTVVLATPTKDTNGINLSWTATPDSAVTGYRVYRAGMNGGYEIIDILGSRTLVTYRDASPKLGVTYSYRIGALAGAGVEYQSNIQTITAGQYIDVMTQVTAMKVDKKRPYLYAIDTVNNSLLFVNTTTKTLEKTIFIGSRPQDLDINVAGNELYVANFGATEIAVVNLDTREKARALTVNTHVGTWDGNPYRLACTAGDTVAFTSQDQWQDVKLVNAMTGANLTVAQGSFYYPYLAASPDGTHLYVGGDGLTRFDVAGSALTMADSSGDNGLYGNKIVVSGDGKYIYYGAKKVLATNLKSQLGTLAEAILATNGDGSIAIGAASVHDGNTFGIISALPLSTSIMALGADGSTLYLYDTKSSRIYIYELKAK